MQDKKDTTPKKPVANKPDNQPETKGGQTPSVTPTEKRKPNPRRNQNPKPKALGDSPASPPTAPAPQRRRQPAKNAGEVAPKSAATTNPTNTKPAAQKPPAQKSPAQRPPAQRQRQNQSLATQPAKSELAKPNQTQRPGGVGAKKGPTLRIIPLGGLGEVGKNITVYESGKDLIVVDCGLAFPNDDMPGVDIVLPDFTYLVKNKEKIRGVFITHGHEDHIGSLAYLLKEINVPVYGTKLTIGLIEGKLKEHGLLGRVKLNTVTPGTTITAGCLSVEYIRVNHSIPDACSFAITSPVGTIIQTGDFKVDYTPVSGGVIDLARFGAHGSKGVLALLSDSTNAEKPGTVPSERTVGESLARLFHAAEGKRIIVATFASNVDRVQQIVNQAAQAGRHVAVSGRSMVNVCAKALELGYLKDPKNVMIEPEDARRFPGEKMVFITTGSQGEPMSALSRMASGDHRQLSITSNDYVILSASPIPGNEKTVGQLVNDLMKLGAEVIYEKSYQIHVSGHACQDDQKLMLALTKPKFFMPVHGEFKHLNKHASIGRSMGIPPENILIAENGDVVETDGKTFAIVSKVQVGSVMVDGLGVGDVGSVVLRDRKLLSEDGLIIVVTTIDRKTGAVVSGPDIVSRGFVYVRESDELMNQAKKAIRTTLAACAENNVREWGTVRNRIRDELSFFVYQKTRRRPIILPIIMEV